MNATNIYLIVQTPTVVMDNYNQGEFAKNNQEMIRQLRFACNDFDFEAYRGIGRNPLVSFPSLDENIIDIFANEGIDMKSDAKARREFRTRINEAEARGETSVYSDDYLITLDDARFIWSYLEQPDNYEIIRVSCSRNSSEDLLGYDVGWFANYSIICDSIVRPFWHPPARRDFEQLAAFARQMNKHTLFPTSEDATRFLDWYRTRPWGEDYGFEDSALCVMQIESINGK